MKPRTLNYAVVLYAIICVAAVGCSSVRDRNSTPTVALAVRLLGDIVPPADYLTHIRAGLQPHLLRAGFALIDDARLADYVLTVAFTPAIDGKGGHVSIATFEPARRFREATDGGDTPEAKEWRRRQREIEAFIGTQSRIYEY